jgi:uncharacterized protein YqeY
MNFQKKIDQEMLLAAKEKNKLRLSAVRLIKAALHNKEIDIRRNLDETDFLQLLSAMVKQRKDSIDQFKKGGRMDLVEKEEAEIRVIQEFMPEQMSEEDVSAEVETAIREVGAVTTRDMGKVMKVLMPRIMGRADGKLVGDKVKSKLSS